MLSSSYLKKKITPRTQLEQWDVGSKILHEWFSHHVNPGRHDMVASYSALFQPSQRFMSHWECFRSEAKKLFKASLAEESKLYLLTLSLVSHSPDSAADFQTFSFSFHCLTYLTHLRKAWHVLKNIDQGSIFNAFLQSSTLYLRKHDGFAPKWIWLKF